MSIVTKEWAKKFEEAGYFNEILDGLKEIQEKNGYTDEEMANDLDVALWKAYVYNNRDSYLYYDLSEKILAKVKEKGIKSGIWCYRYSCALVYLRRYEDALEYSRLGTQVEPDYPWGWLQLGRLCYKFNLLDEAFKAIEKGLELVPNDYEFLTLKDDIENNRGFAYATSHYINEEVDKNFEERLLDVDDEEKYQEFLKKSDLEKELDILHDEDEHEKIIEIITSLPKEKQTVEILGKLARAYNNNDESEKGLEVLFQIEPKMEDKSLWNYRVGYSYFGMRKYEEAEKYAKKSVELDPDNQNGKELLRYIYMELGESREEEGKSEEALEFYLKAREWAKTNDEIINVESAIAWTYDHIRQYEKAYNYLKNILELGRDDIWVHSEMGFCLGGLEKNEEGIEEFEKAIELGRNDSWIYARVGKLYSNLEKYDIALESYLKGLERDPEDFWLNAEVAWLYGNVKGEFTKEIAHLDKMRKMGRDDIWINSEYSWVYNQMKKYDKALKYSLKAKELGRDDEWIYFEIGFAMVRLDKVQEGIENYYKAKELGRDDVGLNSELGYWLDAVEKYEEALICLTRAVELGRDDTWIHCEMGFCLNRLERYSEGLLHLEKAHKLNEKDEWINTELGYCLKKLGRYEEALNYYLTSEKLGRDDEWLNVEIAECLGELQREEEAIARLQRTLTFPNCNKQLINSQIGYLYGRSDTEKALKYLYEAERLGRNDIWLYSEIGWNLANRDDGVEKSLEYFDRAVKLGRDDLWIIGQLGYVYTKLGRYKEAIEKFEKALFIAPQDVWIQYQYGYTLRKKGDMAKAIEVLTKVLETNQYKGWVDLELAICYASIDDRENAEKFLVKAEQYIGKERESSAEVRRDFELVKQLLQVTMFLS